jgi:hypothetical protein
MPRPPIPLYPARGSFTPFFTLPGTIRAWPPRYNSRERTPMDDRAGRRGMEPTEDLGEYTTFIVRVRQDDAGQLSGVVERVRTGEKVPFHGLQTLSRAVASLLSSVAGGS